ncbi:benzoate para-hydroxylase [Rickenella mellea]|uniref:Benzoate para-hydroxylase n=1 Tax=Rickenella mellea TaxID=50990 RepID=A0A4Y7QJK9_9AGAM|nr:benzoate para-hydroxylase [Rickenella mellea]
MGLSHLVPQLSPIPCLALGLVVTLILHSTKRYSLFRDPLRHIPGPPLARWTGLWLAYQVRMGRRYVAVDQAHKEYGPVVRITPTHVSFSDPAALSVIYAQGSAALQKSPFYDAFVGATASVFSTRVRSEHALKRRQVAPAFSVRSLEGLVPILHGRMTVFLNKLQATIDDNKEDGYVDIREWLHYFTFDTISDLLFGEPVGMIAQGSDLIEVKRPNGRMYKEHIIPIMDDREHVAVVVGVMPSLRFIASWLPDPFFIRGRKSTEGMDLLARQRVEHRVAAGTQRDDILSRFVDARLKDTDEVTISAEQITDLTAESLTLLIAGSQSTATSSSVALHQVCANPRVYVTLMAELERAVPPDELPTYDHVKNLPYLQACITEALRHHGTNAVGLPRLAPPGGVTCCGTHFPEGTEMSVPSYTLHHNENIWGDPENYRPERWLENPALHRTTLMFGMGPRGCIGKHLATMEIQIILSTLLLLYDVELKSPVLVSFERFQREPLDVLVHLTRRKHARSP